MTRKANKSRYIPRSACSRIRKGGDAAMRSPEGRREASLSARRAREKSEVGQVDRGVGRSPEAERTFALASLVMVEAELRRKRALNVPVHAGAALFGGGVDAFNCRV